MKLYHHKVGIVTSTNDIAIELLKEHDLVAVTADFQTKGRGRNARTWLGNSGENVYCTFGIHHPEGEVPANVAMIYQVIGALTALEALNSVAPDLFLRLKYPNDVMSKMQNGNFGKMCGVIAEHSFLGEFCDKTIIGIGINVKQTQFSGVTHNEPTSLALLGIDTTPEHVIDFMFKSFMKLLKMQFDDIFNIWHSELDFIGKKAKILGNDDNWKIIELKPNGQVLLQNTETGNFRTIDNGDSIRYDLN